MTTKSKKNQPKPIERPTLSPEEQIANIYNELTSRMFKIEGAPSGKNIRWDLEMISDCHHQIAKQEKILGIETPWRALLSNAFSLEAELREALSSAAAEAEELSRTLLRDADQMRRGYLPNSYGIVQSHGASVDRYCVIAGVLNDQLRRAVNTARRAGAPDEAFSPAVRENLNR